MKHELLGKTFACECGRTHTVPVQDLIYHHGALAELPALFARHAPGASILLLADVRTWKAAGEAAADELNRNGFQPVVQLLPDPPHGDPVCDDLTRAWLESRVPAGITALLAVGSGAINDLAKWIAKDRKLPYMVVATAASMNGYTSANIAPAIGGVKCMLDGRAPFAVAAVPAVIAGAPWPLTAAGLGDVIAKPVSMTDWTINQLLFDEYFCPLCARLIRDLEPVYMNHPEGLLNKEPASLEALFMALLYSGLSMTLAGTSFPASGGEHMMSHVLDMQAMATGGRHDYHGRQVGLGAIVSAALYERLLALEKPDFRLRLEPADDAYWGSLTPVVEKEYAKKRGRLPQAVDRLRTPGMWDQVRGLIRQHAVPAARIKQCLEKAGAAHRIADIGCSRAAFVRAMKAGHQIRARYSVLDLALAAGILPDAADEIADAWLAS